MSGYEHISVEPGDIQMLAALKPLLEKSASMHHHLCPRQVLGVRVGVAGMRELNFKLPIRQKRLLVIAETDGCFVSGVQAATGCSVNRRTMRINDIGRIGVTFVDVKSEQAVRVAPRTDLRQTVSNLMTQEADSRRARYIAMLEQYQQMPEDQLLTIEPVKLSRPVREIVSRPFVRVDCAVCGEEVINEREVLIDGRPTCQSCAGNGYYTVTDSA